MVEVKLTDGALLKLSRQYPQTTDLKPVVQVTDIWSVQKQTSGTGYRKENFDKYDIMISDGSYCQIAMLDPFLDDLIRSQHLNKGSVVRLCGFVRRWFCDRMSITINEVDVITAECNIIGDPKPMPERGFHVRFVADSVPTGDVDNSHHVRALTKAHSCSFCKEQKCTKSSNSNNMDKNREDNVDDCIDKLEKLGWETQDQLLYDTALLLFCESDCYRRVWLRLLKPESCEKWVRNVGSKHGLLG